jgi:hypothetical protein
MRRAHPWEGMRVGAGKRGFVTHEHTGVTAIVDSASGIGHDTGASRRLVGRVWVRTTWSTSVDYAPDGSGCDEMIDA